MSRPGLPEVRKRIDSAIQGFRRLACAEPTQPEPAQPNPADAGGKKNGEAQPGTLVPVTGKELKTDDKGKKEDQSNGNPKEN